MSENQTSKFVCGVLDTFELANTDDLAVVGRVKGTLNKGDKICITNYGDDDDELVVSSIVAIEVDKKPADSVTDSFAALRIRDGSSENIKPGSVLHSEDTEEDEIRLAYVSSIGDSYVGRRDLEIYETELNRMSITDCRESLTGFMRKKKAAIPMRRSKNSEERSAFSHVPWPKRSFPRTRFTAYTIRRQANLICSREQ